MLTPPPLAGVSCPCGVSDSLTQRLRTNAVVLAAAAADTGSRRHVHGNGDFEHRWQDVLVGQTRRQLVVLLRSGGHIIAALAARTERSRHLARPHRLEPARLEWAAAPHVTGSDYVAA